MSCALTWKRWLHDYRGQRPRDADLLGFGDITERSLAQIFTDVCNTDVEPDGLEYLTSTIHVAPIRPEDSYGGLRTTLRASLGNAHIRVQIDVGIGDAVTPEPEWLEYPGLLDLPQPRLRAYRPETAIAEKLHAMVVLGDVNIRMRDFFDIHALAMRESFEGETLMRALKATFERRRTPLPAEPPIALTPAFARIEGKRAQWNGFIQRNRLMSVPAEIRVFLESFSSHGVPFGCF